MKNTKTWILVADGALARTFETGRGAKGLVAVKRGEFAAANLPSREIDADKPGQGFDRAGQGQRRMQPRTDSHRHGKAQFARHLAEFLQREQQRRAYDNLIIVAPAQTLGDLRSVLAPGVKALIRAELSKDLVHIGVRELPRHLETVLHP
ncbi:MAG: host attachment protein [Alphaproteobacteria bacterium]|jgi:protein required for attachment to host cells|nr:host attachment protein [Alphaproteobacteria bacterium]